MAAHRLRLDVHVLGLTDVVVRDLGRAGVNLGVRHSVGGPAAGGCDLDGPGAVGRLSRTRSVMRHEHLEDVERPRLHQQSTAVDHEERMLDLDCLRQRGDLGVLRRTMPRVRAHEEKAQ